MSSGDQAVPEVGLGIALRTAWLDDAVGRWTGTQVVLLGAGFDSRAARLARPGLSFFEIDHPATQAEKRAILKDLRDYPRDAATMLACDFEKDDFAALLLGSGFRREEPTLVLWEGVVAYLTEAAVRATVRKLAAILIPPSMLLFDPIAPPGGAQPDGFSRVARDAGEPFLFTCPDVRPLLLGEGFSRAETMSMDELAKARRVAGASSAPLFARWSLASAYR
jgi:methyltransferase (TIGR00027 family)